MIDKKVTVVVPAIARDIPVLLGNIDLYFNYLPVKQLCVIGDSEVQSILPSDERIVFINENDIIPINEIKRVFSSRCRLQIDNKRCGWYIQQFIKMEYAKLCPDDYYLLWDSDTIPIKSIELFTDVGQPYLDYKTEYYKSYFETIDVLIPGMRKEFSGSFISEHMLVNTCFMKELLNTIDNNTNLAGDNVYVKIINAIDTRYLAYSGFSEFETYGTYVYKNYPGEYFLRPWKSLRYGSFFFYNKSLTPQVSKWLARKYHAISFEKNNKISKLSYVVNTRSFRKLFPATVLESLSIIVRGERLIKRKLFKKI